LAIITAGVYFLYPILRKNPEKREKKRRLHVNRQGRVGDAFITEASETTISYTYLLRGVQHETSQDIAVLRDYLPAEPERLIGQAHVKYLVNNPANSILLCEEWSGLRIPGVTPSKPPVSESAQSASAARHHF
jgi:hypothetical protein